MNFDILYRPAHTLAKVALAPGETVVAEAGAMVAKSAAWSSLGSNVFHA